MLRLGGHACHRRPPTCLQPIESVRITLVQSIGLAHRRGGPRAQGTAERGGKEGVRGGNDGHNSQTVMLVTPAEENAGEGQNTPVARSGAPHASPDSNWGTPPKGRTCGGWGVIPG